MDAKTFSLVAGVIFAVVALFHLVRIFMEWTVIIGDWSIPLWVSWIALVVAGGLALLGLRLSDQHFVIGSSSCHSYVRTMNWPLANGRRLSCAPFPSCGTHMRKGPSDYPVPRRSCSVRFSASIWNGFLRVGRSR